MFPCIDLHTPAAQAVLYCCIACMHHHPKPESVISRALDILLGIACALDHVHQHNIVHLDLKSPNCLYDLHPSK